ncbi:MAG: putative toxin-antitoxin system toxin component, PIN family [Chlamydiae bacterium]|nr:putative toxin-antitoxin system toxin component, PIN family [Chlamydiota bacterium]MBI3277783.1 putative toxin-antitoxin system toxin component, PIN family [Chlamydiota bacterium]
MKVVCDTNILISALLFPGGPPDHVISLARLKEITLCLSPDIFSEFKKVLMVKFKYSEGETEKFLDRLTNMSNLVYPRERIQVIHRVEQDNRILECALEAEADFLISGDKKDILPLKKIGKTIIISAAEFLEYYRRH